MGKQINYYMDYSDFQKLAQQAIDYGCEILKEENGKIIHSKDISVITPNVNRYFFYLPEAGRLTLNVRNGIEYIGGYNSSGNVVIEASFSVVNHEKKKISRARIFLITGYNDEHGNWIDRPECLKKVYEKLVRGIKKIAPYTEIPDTIISTVDDSYEKEREWKHKEYISPALLTLKINNGYKIGL